MHVVAGGAGERIVVGVAVKGGGRCRYVVRHGGGTRVLEG
jgi:hypothetical protein